jgi:hypothetical protein
MSSSRCPSPSPATSSSGGGSNFSSPRASPYSTTSKSPKNTKWKPKRWTYFVGDRKPSREDVLDVGRNADTDQFLHKIFTHLCFENTINSPLAWYVSFVSLFVLRPTFSCRYTVSNQPGYFIGTHQANFDKDPTLQNLFQNITGSSFCKRLAEYQPIGFRNVKMSGTEEKGLSIYGHLDFTPFLNKEELLQICADAKQHSEERRQARQQLRQQQQTGQQHSCIPQQLEMQQQQQHIIQKQQHIIQQQQQHIHQLEQWNQGLEDELVKLRKEIRFANSVFIDDA